MNQIPRLRILSAAKKRQACRFLKRGGVLAYATESCFGLGGLPTHPKAIRQVIRLKKRNQNKGLIVVASDFSQLRSLVEPLTKEQLDTVNQYWPGPYTFLLKAKNRVLPYLRGFGNQKLAVRISAHPQTALLCKALGYALVSSSANIAKQHPCKNTRQAQQKFGKKALVIKGQIGVQHKPSTLIDLETGKVLRG